MPCRVVPPVLLFLHFFLLSFFIPVTHFHFFLLNPVGGTNDGRGLFGGITDLIGEPPISTIARLEEQTCPATAATTTTTTRQNAATKRHG